MVFETAMLLRLPETQTQTGASLNSQPVNNLKIWLFRY
jgi:hypothetical protein